jgi:DNA-binding transcriptional LysR family regulator
VDFNLDRLRTFIVVARTSNLSAAAKELGATQPNVGRQMTALEKEVRLTLFFRHSRGIYLTKQGEDFLELCHDIVGQLAQRTDVIREKGFEPEGTLTVATGTGSLEDIVKNLSSFSQLYPKLNFHFSPKINVFQLQIGDSDVSFSPILFSDPDLVQHHVYDMILRIYATPNYLKSHSKLEALDDLKSHQLVVYEGENQNVFNSQVINPQTMDFYKNPFVKVNSGPSMRFCLLNHLGIGPYAYDQELEEKKLLVDVFPGMTDYRIPYYYAYHRRLDGSPKIKVFHDFLKEAIRTRQRPEPLKNS